jgi:predicted  nucleic acid-binding Zn-ribbon protein
MSPEHQVLQLEDLVAKLEDELDGYKNMHSQMIEEMDELEEKLEEAENALETAKDANEDLREQISSLKDDVSDLEQQIALNWRHDD